MAGPALPTIPIADVESHNTEQSCYVTLGAHVYDVTDFLPDHPGGGDLILDYAGKDVSEIMNDETSHFHSEAAYDVLKERKVGYVATPPIINAAVEGDSHDILPLPPNANGMREIEVNGAAEEIDKPEVYESTGMSSEADLTKETDVIQDYKGEQFLDLSKPLLMQVWNGGFEKDFYLKQVHKPRYYGKNGASAPLFGNFLEPLSKTAWWVIPIVWLPPVAYGTYVAYLGMPSGFETAFYWLLGLSLWSLIEYGLHRGLFHVDKYLPDNRVGITAHFLLHGIHHYLPMDKLRLVMPPALFLVLATPFYKLAHTIFYWDWYVANAVFCGGIFGYICYDLTHYFLHHKNLPFYYKQLKKYHLQHHYADYANGFGVTSRFWDKVFGTELPSLEGKRVKVA